MCCPTLRRAAGAGVDGSRWPVRGGKARRDIGAGAETGVDQAARAQIVERRLIAAQPLRLAHRVAVPSDAEPSEVRQRSDDIGLARAAAVDIVDAEPEAPARAPRRVTGEQRAIGMAEVQLAGRAGREAGQHGARFESICCGTRS